MEKIDHYAFYNSGLARVDIPGSLKTLAQGAFAMCKNLKKVSFDDGLRMLGTNKRYPSGSAYMGVFESSGIESVQLPSTLQMIESRAFKDC